VDIYTVSRWLGHSSVSTTERHYVDLHAAGHLAAIRLVNAAAAVRTVAGGRARSRARKGSRTPQGQ
jgi:integrase